MRNLLKTLRPIAVAILMLAGVAGCSQAPSQPANPQEDKDLYLDLMMLSLTDLLYENDEDNRVAQREGRAWPGRAYSMIGIKRLENIQMCVEDVIANNIPGDLIEAGAWRGGATILMRAILKANRITDRAVWVADSFEGLPTPDPEKYPDDRGFNLHEADFFSVSQEEVEKNFDRYGLLDDQVHFLKGWFKDTLPTAPIEKLAVLRIDADMYESTMDALNGLYHKLSPGGYAIFDDYFLIPACTAAVDDFREEHGITEEILKMDWNAGYWQKRATPTDAPAPE